MKALPLLQALAEVQKRAVMYPVVGRSAINRVNAQYRREVDALIAFYSQPFTVEMLTGERAVFAGWKIAEPDEFWHDFRLGPHHDYMVLYPMVDDCYEYSIKHSPAPESVYYDRLMSIKPTTISQFIEDCDRAGISLDLTPYGQEMLKGGGE